MKNLRNRFERFCFRNRDKGIPNLMLYLTLGSALVYLMSFFTRNYVLYDFLCFDREQILQGQIWRLFSYPLTFASSNILITAIALVCYYSLGRAMEHIWGTLRFNLFYLSGVVMMDLFSLIFGGQADVTYLNLSLFLSYATLYPNSQFLLFYIIPVKAWIFAVFDLALTAFEVIALTVAGAFPISLFPIVALLNYFLFFGKDVVNVIPLSWRVKMGRKSRKKPAPKTIRFDPRSSTPPAKAAYTHRCTVCGRTDVSDPELEFRYCSRCKGYYCYCQDHISSHSHVQ